MESSLNETQVLQIKGEEKKRGDLCCNFLWRFLERARRRKWKGTNVSFLTASLLDWIKPTLQRYQSLSSDCGFLSLSFSLLLFFNLFSIYSCGISDCDLILVLKKKKKKKRVSFRKEMKEIIFYLAWLVLKL